MKQSWLILLLVFLTASTAWGNHALPRRGSEDTFVLEVFAFEHDPHGISRIRIQESLRGQGYNADGEVNSFANTMGLFPGSSLYEIGDFEWDVCDDDLDIAIVWSHAEYVTDYHFIAMEAYTFTPEGEETRDRRYGDLGYWYQQGTEIRRGFRSQPGGVSFHDIGVSSVFLTENGDALPDFLQIVGCKTADSRWITDLCREDRIRTVVACSDTLLWTRLIIDCASSSKWHTSRLQNKRHFPEHCRPDDLLLSLRQGPVLTTPAA